MPPAKVEHIVSKPQEGHAADTEQGCTEVLDKLGGGWGRGGGGRGQGGEGRKEREQGGEREIEGKRRDESGQES